VQTLSQWKSTTYSECESVALGIQHVMRMRRIIFSFVVCLAVPYFSTLPHKRHHFRKKKVMEHKKMCVLIFSITCHYFKKSVVKCYHKYTEAFMQSTHYSCRAFFFFVIKARDLCPRCTAACRLIVLPLYRASILDVPTFRCQSVSSSVLPERPLAAKGGTFGRE
jgi:hypothetical protein